MPDVVIDELTAGAERDVSIQAVLDADWIERRELVQPEEIIAFTKFSKFLVRDGRNRGETGVPALACTVGGIAIVDDNVARRVAREHGIPVRGTLGLLVDAIRDELLTVALVSVLADDLLASQYRLPFGRGGFAGWAGDNGLL